MNDLIPCRCYVSRDDDNTKTWHTPIDDHTLEPCLEINGKEVDSRNLLSEIDGHLKQVLLFVKEKP